MAPLDWVVAHDPLGPTAWTALAGMLAWIAFAEPWLGVKGHRHFLADLSQRDDARRRFYLRWTCLLTVLGGVVLAAFALVPGLSWSALGMRADVSRVEPLAIIIMVGAGVAGAMVTAIMTKHRGTPPPVVGDIAAMLPTTREERRYFILLSFAAGVFEEIIWRGMPVFAVYAIAPDAPVYWPIGISAILFGIAHLYQGKRGVFATAYLGGVLCWLYLYSGSLLLPMLLHVVIDVRAGFWRPLVSASQAEASPSHV